jgi:hypothetical protein
VCTDDLGIRKRDSVNIVALRTSELRMDIVTKNFTPVQFDFFLCVYSFTPPTCSIFLPQVPGRLDSRVDETAVVPTRRDLTL